MNLRLYRPPQEDRRDATSVEPRRTRGEAGHWTALLYPLLIAIATILAMAFAGRAFADERLDLLTQYGTPDNEWASRGAYLTTYDARTCCPRWVLERLDAEQLAVSVVRDNEGFISDASIPLEFRVVPADYRRSGFDIGHLAPAAVHRTSQQDLDSTFLLSNAVPQPHSVNAGVWLALENEVASLAKTSSVWVITAPLWIAEDNGELRVRTIGRRTVWVPTHVGKAVLVQESQRVDRLRAWVIPNSEEACRGKRFQDFQVRVDQFETQSGLNVFSALPDELEERLEGATP